MNDEANAFGAAQMTKDAEGFQLSDVYKGVDVTKIQSALCEAPRGSVGEGP